VRKSVVVNGVAVALIAMSMTGCGILDAGKHKVGECVHTRASLGGTEITSSDCPAKGTTMIDNIADPIYKITAVLDYTASCPADGTPGIELKHEPDDAVYCLEIARA
jgi:hypothetical protein